MGPMGHADPHGYYRVIGVAPRASRAAVLTLHRRRARELEAQGAARPGAAELKAALAEAYKVLSDPEARALYDTEDLTRAAPGAAPGDAPVPCVRCQTVSAQPRYLIFQQAIGRLTHVIHDRVQGVYCPRCARDVALGCSLMTWCVGWWGLPDGPLASVRAIWRNMRWGEFPVRANARLLAHQARAFAARGRAGLARALAARAAELDPEAPGAPALRSFAAEGEGEPPVLQDSWRIITPAAPLHLLPGVALAALVLVVGPFSYGGHRTQAPALPGAPVASLEARPAGAGVLAPGHAAAGGIVLRAGPGPGFPAVATLRRLEGAAVIGPAKDGWVPIRLGQITGFVPIGEVGGISGAGPLKTWCLEHRGERPETGTIVRRTATGHHALAAGNGLPGDALLKLRDAKGNTVVAVYVRAGERARVPDLPDGPFTALYATGGDWSGACETFVTDLAVYSLERGIETRPGAEDPGSDFDPALTLAGAEGGDTPADPALFAAD
jgi:hypothetical protein